MTTARSSIGSPTGSERPSESTRYAVLSTHLLPSCLASYHCIGLHAPCHRQVHCARRAKGTRVAPHAHYASLSVQGEPPKPYRYSGKRLFLLGLRSRAVCVNPERGPARGVLRDVRGVLADADAKHVPCRGERGGAHGAHAICD